MTKEDEQLVVEIASIVAAASAGAVRGPRLVEAFRKLVQRIIDVEDRLEHHMYPDD